MAHNSSATAQHVPLVDTLAMSRYCSFRCDRCISQPDRDSHQTRPKCPRARTSAVLALMRIGYLASTLSMDDHICMKDLVSGFRFAIPRSLRWKRGCILSGG